MAVPAFELESNLGGTTSVTKSNSRWMDGWMDIVNGKGFGFMAIAMKVPVKK